MAVEIPTFPFRNFDEDLKNCVAKHSKKNPQGLTVVQLKAIARKHGLSVTGKNKLELCNIENNILQST